ncbi:polysaccharide biosynthesis/export family protein [Caenispirillum bisanense]|uniref:Polysaccharide export outer membrane protein n=1 Tax=Caenispirillum bisanense TaxID=414052 RepID=A0A286GQF0_9PROT|nr:polysaccharide biosynthesis/export family protein [Caenispirillum bisanense]SOD97204.1 polysaccharide export outer membrane protein [Caenispirillum bisanense]
MRAVVAAVLLLCLLVLAPPVRAEAPAYRLGPGDALRLTVFGEDDLSGAFTVDGSGRVSLPLIGEVRFGGLTLPEAEAAVTARLADGYLKEPRVALEVTNYRPFYILGEVREPGSFPYAAGMTVMSAVALAGGFTYRADEDDIEITPGARDGSPAGPAQQATPETPVLPGDVVRIGERFF